ncbi:DUF2125 domain-containing protein [Brevundimonas kwangchunensis]|uniref:DUF2125 domain-containing protein n=1 Tax=Brevundimonas kwangchunensis TaxID=322163 RepID=A0ABN1H5G6_9CAUL
MTTDSPRHSRRGIIVPFTIAGVVLVAWTAWWFFLVQQIETRLDAQVEALKQNGWTISHAEVTTTGWPFRARVAIPHADIVAPSGHGISAPELVAEANAWNPDHWVVVAPEGLTLARADKGKVGVRGDGLRFSISRLRERFPDLRVELIRPVFTAHEDAEPFPIASADRIQFEARPHREDETADAIDVLFNLQEARGRPGGPVEGATQEGRLTVRLEGVVREASHLAGPTAAGVFAAWTEAGGRLSDVRGELIAGESRARLTSTGLSAGADGRLQGDLSLNAESAGAAITGLARSREGAVNRVGAAGAAAATAIQGERDVDLTIRFRDGRTWLGPFALAPAPRLF